MCGSGEATIGQFPMTIRTGHSIVSHMQVVAEGELVPILLITARHQQHRHQTDGCFLKN